MSSFTRSRLSISADFRSLELNLLRSWSNEHPKIWLSVGIVQSKVVKYSQFHVDNATSQGLKEAGLPIAEFDGGVNIWAASNEDLMSVSPSCN